MPKYNEDILNYYNDDSHIGSLDQNDKNVGTGLVGSPSCGDVMKLQIKVKNNIIEDAKILVFGCGSAKASSSYIAKKLTNMTLNDALKIKNKDIAKALGLPKIKLHCSVLAEDAIKRAINDYQEKQTPNQNIKKEKQQDNTDLNLIISQKAIDFAIKQLEKVEKQKNIKIAGLLLSLEEGHCGLMYKVKYITNEENKDEYLSQNIDNKLTIFIDQKMKEILNGTKIDYKEDGLKRGLIFTNPKETGKCNCGLNFFTDKKPKKQSSC